MNNYQQRAILAIAVGGIAVLIGAAAQTVVALVAAVGGAVAIVLGFSVLYQEWRWKQMGDWEIEQ